MARRDTASFRSPRSRKRQQRMQIIKTGIAAGLLVLLVLVVAYITRLDVLSVGTVAVEGGETVSHDTIRERAEATLSGNYALLIPRRFSYLYPHDNIASAIESIPRVKNAVVTKDSRTGIRVSFSEYSPHGLWCTDVAMGTSTPQQCLFVDETGYAFAEAPPLYGGALPRYKDEHTDPTLEGHLFDPETITTVTSFMQALERDYGIRVRAVTRTGDGDIVFHTTYGGAILVAMSANIQDVFDALASIIASEEFSDVVPVDFEYLDLRFGDKVYLKERQPDVPQTPDDGTPPTTEEASTTPPF